MLIDYHLHSNTSDDAVGSLKEHCESAVKKGLSEICFTNHQEWESVLDRSYVSSMTDNGWNDFFSEVEEMKKAFPELIIRVGCEVGYYPDHMDAIKEFINNHPFDYVIGSLHTFDGRFIREHQAATGDALIGLYRRYFGFVRDMVGAGHFDCLGHIDMIARYKDPVPFGSYKDVIEEIALALKEKDIGFELNTKGWMQKSEECHPQPDILRILKDAGIRKVTIGSDSHDPSDVGYGIGRAMCVLKDAGFREFCTFERRKPIYHPL